MERCSHQSSKVRLYRHFSRRLRGGLVAAVTGAQNRVWGDALFSNDRSTAGGSVKYSIVNAGPAIGYSLYKEAYLTFNTGYSVCRYFEVFDSDQKLLEDSNYERNLFFKLTIEYNVGNSSIPTLIERVFLMLQKTEAGIGLFFYAQCAKVNCPFSDKNYKTNHVLDKEDKFDEKELLGTEKLRPGGWRQQGG